MTEIPLYSQEEIAAAEARAGCVEIGDQTELWRQWKDQRLPIPRVGIDRVEYELEPGVIVLLNGEYGVVKESFTLSFEGWADSHGQRRALDLMYTYWVRDDGGKGNEMGR